MDPPLQLCVLEQAVVLIFKRACMYILGPEDLVVYLVSSQGPVQCVDEPVSAAPRTSTVQSHRDHTLWKYTVSLTSVFGFVDRNSDSTRQWRIHDFPDRRCQPLDLRQKPIIWQDIWRKLHENERILTGGGRGARALALPWIRQWLFGIISGNWR